MAPPPAPRPTDPDGEPLPPMPPAPPPEPMPEYYLLTLLGRAESGSMELFRGWLLGEVERVG